MNNAWQIACVRAAAGAVNHTCASKPKSLIGIHMRVPNPASKNTSKSSEFRKILGHLDETNTGVVSFSRTLRRRTDNKHGWQGSALSVACPFKPWRCPIRPSNSRVKNRSSRGVVHTYAPDLGHPGGQGPQLLYKAISSVRHHLSPF